MSGPRCEGCGGELRPGEGSEVEVRLRVRPPPARRPGGGWELSEPRIETRRRRVCVVCARKVGDGADLASLRGRRSALWLALFALALLLVAAATPLLLPVVRSALFLGDARR